MTPQTSLRQTLIDPALLGGVLGGESWAAWRAILLASMGEPLDHGELDHFRRLTGRYQPPPGRVEELWAIVGRRGGKSSAMAGLAIYLAGFCDYRDVLKPGERGVCLLIAPDQRQARIALDYATGALESTPLLAQLIANRNADSLELTTGVTLEVRSASFRRLRGPTCVAVIADEAAFWLSEESSNPDTEILNAVRPSLATTRGPLIVISSPYSRRGELWDAYSKHYGDKGDRLILVAKGTSRDFNPSLPQDVIDRAYERDPVAAAAEYGAEFRSDVEAFVSREAVEACVEGGVFERPFNRAFRYVAFCDPSGGSSDAFTLAVAHREGERVVLDALRERRPPFSPEDVVEEFCSLLGSYKVTAVHGDRYGGEFPRELFSKRGITYRVSERSKSELYQDILPKLNARMAVLLDHPLLVNQFVGLERRVARGGRESIDHRPGAHDDITNSVAGALLHVGYGMGAVDHTTPPRRGPTPLRRALGALGCRFSLSGDRARHFSKR